MMIQRGYVQHRYLNFNNGYPLFINIFYLKEYYF